MLTFVPSPSLRCWCLSSVFVVAAACGGGDERRNGSGLDGLTKGASSGGGTDGGSGGGGGGGGSNGAPKFDLDDGGGPMSGGGETESCSKIDFLFVVDNSNSMQEEQQALVASFPGFMETVLSATGARDFHVMVIDSDSFCDRNPRQYVPCNTRPPMTCDETLGAGKLKSKYDMDCGVNSGKRYMTDAQADLKEAFACLAEVGTEGSSNEEPMGAMVQAISPEFNAPGACNEGFVRKDALLVVVIITDESDDDETVTKLGCGAGNEFDGSAGTPATWYDAIVAAKGTETNAVVLSLVGPDGMTSDPELMPCEGDAGCISKPNGAQQAPTILEFTRRFTHGAIGRICSLEYSPFFAGTVEQVVTACRSYQPPV